jgi:phosphatidylglycerol lysyltransferase
MAEAARRQVLELLRRHGYNATSFQALEDGFRYFFAGDGCVAYWSTGGAWVAAGAPICAAERLAELASRFVEAARREGKRAVFFAAEDRLRDATGWPSLPLGEQPVWDPRAWPARVAGSRSLRAQLARARNKGVTTRLVPAAEIRDAGSPVRLAADRLIQRWLLSRKMAPMGFLVDVQPFLFAEERRYVVAEQDGKVIGFLAAVPVYQRGGWFFEDFLRDPEAPNGTMELLVDAGMHAVAAEGASYVTLGLAPLAGRVPGWLARVRELSAPLYDFGGLHAFKAKLRPDRWDPVHLVWPAGHFLRPLVDSLGAFARGSFVGFGLRTLLRGPVLVLWALALALVPWTALLAAAPVATWFPSPAVKWAWVGFDVLLCLALVSLARRFRRRLAITLCVAVGADALITCLEAALWNAPRVAHPGQWLVLATACLAPTLAALVLVGATRRASALARL